MTTPLSITTRTRDAHHVALEVQGVTALAMMTGEARLELFEWLARAERELGGDVQIHISPGEASLRILVARRAALPRLSKGQQRSALLSPISHEIARATHVDLLAAFVMTSGVALIARRLDAALARGARVRVLTGDYLGRTRPAALHHLLDIAQRARLGDDEVDAWPGALEVRVVEMTTLGRDVPSFHPKAWIFSRGERGRAYVGSSNLSRAALLGGVEWNMRLDRAEDPGGFEDIQRAFDELWSLGTPLTRSWIEAYSERAEAPSPRRTDREEDGAESIPPPTPRPLQREALEVLAAHRREGHRRALVVMATGLGKTFLAAFDVRAFERALGRRARVLFVAHRVELLRQAAETFRRVFPERSAGFLVGGVEELGEEMTFASVFTLARGERLEAFADVDYVIIDEAHHAEAKSYRVVLEAISPAFLMGLTATPERGDGVDVSGLFGGAPLFEARLGEGIRQGALVPFRYLGLKDTIDYEPLPWRSGRFDDEALASAAATAARMDRLWEAWQEHSGARTLVFCCSITHADFVAGWLKGCGVRAVAVHSGEESADRAEAIDALTEGVIDAICVVDLFNEGVDIPAVDRVVMLRPTGSRVVFLQQLGRGLRCAPGKQDLCVIDFVGNHRVFLERVHTLVEWLRDVPLRTIELRAPAALAATLPPGCHVDIELGAIDMLTALAPEASDSALLDGYRRWRRRHGARARADELQAHGLNVWTATRGWGGWFALVHEEGDLSDDELRVLGQTRRWFEAIERTRLDLEQLAALGVLVDLMEGVGALAASRARWASECDDEVIDALLELLPMLRERDGEVTLDGVAARDVEVWAAMSREVLGYLGLRRRRLDGPDEDTSGFVARVFQTKGKPILKLPDRERVEGIPRGEITARLPSGEAWVFRLVKIACNVAYPVGQSRNELPALLRRWFGASAGQPGTSHRVRFTPTLGGWSVGPVHREGHRLAPFEPGEVLSAGEIAARLDLDEARITADAQLAQGDYAVCFVAASDALLSYDLLRVELEGAAAPPRAQVFFAADHDGERAWRYHGEGAADEDRGGWAIEDVELETYRAHSDQRGVSRRLPARASAWAEAFLERFGELYSPGDVIEARGKRCRVVEITSRGSVRIEGVGECGFKPRSISRTDLSWVLLARMRAAERDVAHVDEAFVNQLRYLPGTPKKSTRYIDTGWALVLTEALAP